MKICTKCKIEKSLEEFYISNKAKTGRTDACKNCFKIYSNNNKEAIRLKTSLWRKKEGNLERHKKWIADNLDRINNQRRERRLKNLDVHRKRQNDYYQANKKRIIKLTLIRDKQKSIKDPIFKLKNTLRLRILNELTNRHYKKTKRTQELLGASVKLVKIHLELQFVEGMTWENHGYKTWHIDHITPLASAKTEQELLLLFHYTNLQPLWAKENMSKGKKLPKGLIKTNNF